ncbi:MAG TPA: hypothetical protein DDZ83_10305 [Nitrospinae bacterium]|nr:hypothetical protein [Nitrospinota bacterium]
MGVFAEFGPMKPGAFGKGGPDKLCAAGEAGKMKIRRRNHSPVEKGKTFRKNKPPAVQAHPERSVLMVHLEIKDKLREADVENSVLEAAPFRVLRVPVKQAKAEALPAFEFSGMGTPGAPQGARLGILAFGKIACLVFSRWIFHQIPIPSDSGWRSSDWTCTSRGLPSCWVRASLREMARSAAGMTTGSPSGQGGSKKYSK